MPELVEEGDMDLQAVFERHGDYVSREVAGEMILVPVRSGPKDVDSIFTLNEVGSVVWRELGAGRNVQQILECVTTEFETTREQAEADVVEFLEALEQRSLIRPVRSGWRSSTKSTPSSPNASTPPSPRNRECRSTAPSR